MSRDAEPLSSFPCFMNPWGRATFLLRVVGRENNRCIRDELASARRRSQIGERRQANTPKADEPRARQFERSRRAELPKGLAAQGAEARRAEARASQSFWQLPRRGKPAGVALKGRQPSLPCRRLRRQMSERQASGAVKPSDSEAERRIHHQRSPPQRAVH